MPVAGEAGSPPKGVHPVVLDWEKVAWVKERGGNGDLVMFRCAQQDDDELSRKDLLNNKEVLAPVLKHMGILVSITMG